jgi:PAS domain-containing protein
MAPDGTVIAANQGGRDLAAVLLQGEPPLIAPVLPRATAEGSIASQMMQLPVKDGQIVIDLTVVPRARSDALLLLVRDVTMEHNLRPALIESRQRYKDLVEVSSDFAWEVGPDGAFVFVSSQSALGYAADELIGQRPAELVVDAAAYRPFPFQSDHRSTASSCGSPSDDPCPARLRAGRCTPPTAHGCARVAGAATSPASASARPP